MNTADTRRRVALVTGAAAGLGSRFAERLARDGFDLILVDRQAERTQVLADDLARRYAVRTHVIVRDLTVPSAAADIQAACDALGWSVDVLVNNAGFHLNKALHELPLSAVRDNIQLLLRVVVEMCHRFLPPMINRGWGRIINVSSVSGFMPGSVRLATYNASKSFLIPFSEAIGLELAGTGVNVTAVCPGFMKTDIFVSSGLTDVGESVPAFMWTDPAQVADEAIHSVMKGVPVRVSGIPNRLIVFASKFVPRSLLRERSRIFHKAARRSQSAGQNATFRSSDEKKAALVTGASSGIGASFSNLLAKEGYDIVLVARRREALERCADELSSRYGVLTHVIVQDLTVPEAPENIATECERLGWPIGVLVNNAGYPTTELFHKMSWAEVDAALRILVTNVVELTHKFLPQMVARGSGMVINVASMAAFEPGSFRSSLYSSSKVFIVGFSESIAAEVAGSGVIITALCPGFTRTNWLSKNKLENTAVPSFLWMESDAVAEIGYSAAQRGTTVAVAGTPALRAIYTLFQVAPRRLIGAMLSKKRRRMAT
jgi:short-subunit dehydrogenase